jgi:hypothetical protein
MSPPFMPRPLAKKWWLTQLGVEIPISQWGEATCTQDAQNLSFWAKGGQDFVWNLVFSIVSSCSHHFFNGLIVVFWICSSGSQYILNNTTLYHITFTKSSPLVTYKDIIEEKTTIYVSTLGVAKDWSIFLGVIHQSKRPITKNFGSPHN